MTDDAHLNVPPFGPTYADPNNVPVTFVNELIVSGFLNGNVNMTLATAHFTPMSDKKVVPDLVVASRLRFDLMCAQQIHAALGRIIEQSTKPAGKAN